MYLFFDFYNNLVNFLESSYCVRMGDERNFRSQFYGKVGLREVEDKRAVEALFKEQPLDERKFSNFCQRSVVPGAYRFLVWKLLLHVTPRYAESQDYVRQQQTLMFEELWRTLKSMGLQNIVVLGNDSSSDLTLPVIDEVNTKHKNKDGYDIPIPENYLLMWLISEAKLLYSPKDQLKYKAYQHFLKIVIKIQNLFDNPVDVFHVSSALYSLLRKNETAISNAVMEAIGMLRKENDSLHRHLMKVGLFSSTLLVDLCLSLFCDIFPETAVEKILDKVIAGAFRVFAFVIFSLLVHLKQPLMSVSSVENARSIINMIRKDEAEILVTSALDQWLKFGIVKRSQQ